MAALALPSAMAYAELAGVSAVHGLYALLLPAVLSAFLGSSKPLCIGPEGSVAALVGAAVLPLAAAGSGYANELGALLALLVAACFALAWLLRLGRVADYLSRPVLIGYIHGVVVVILVAQLGKILGLSIDATKPIPQLWEIVRELDETSLWSLAVGTTALAILLVVRRIVPRFPTALVVLAGAMLVSWAADLSAHGVAIIGSIPSGLPSLGLPGASLLDAALQWASSCSPSPTRC